MKWYFQNMKFNNTGALIDCIGKNTAQITKPNPQSLMSHSINVFMVKN
jgi:hypothetical protein